MTEYVPTRVSLYMIRSVGEIHAAEFRYSPTGGVALTVHDARHGGDIAQDLYDRGVPDDVERRAVPRTEPEAFMRTLLQPRRMSYYRWADESDRADG